MARAESSLEYAIVILGIVAALLAMRIYITRGIQGRLKQTADELGQQYQPGSTTSNITISSSGRTTTNVYTKEVDGKLLTITNTTINSTESRYGNETVAGN